MKETQQIVEILNRLISFRTFEKKGITAAVDWIESWAREQHLVITKFANTKALLLETCPEASKHISFVAHVDVVFGGDWEQAFTPRVEGEFLFARGTVDDLGPLAVCLFVMSKIKEAKDINVSCLIVTDEETTNTEIQEVLKSKKYSPTLCIVVDGGTHDTFDIGQKGIISAGVTITTAGGHSAFEERYKSACLELLCFISILEKDAQRGDFHAEFSPTFVNVSTFISESMPYGLPSQARANIEVQFPLPQKSAHWLTTLKNLERQFQNCTVDINWVSEPHLMQQEKVLEFLHSFPNIKCITTGGNNLAKDISLAGIPAVSHCPVSEYIAHCHNEKIRLDDLDQGMRFYLHVIERFQMLQ